MQYKKIKYFATTTNENCQNMGFFYELWDSTGGFNEFKREFFNYFPYNARERVKDNLNKVQDIYLQNYACPDGFLDNMFYYFFRDKKQYAKFRKLLLNEKFNEKQFWALGIL